MAAGSLLLAQELFERADPAFVAEIVRCGGRKKLRRFAIRWSEARGAFARESRIALADRNIDRGDARVLVKVLFKAAERRGDDVEMAHHLVSFDRLIRRVTRRDQWYHWGTQTMQYGPWRRRLPRVWRRNYPEQGPDHFSNNTRYYLQRRALRHFRRLGYAEPDRFVEATAFALSLYDDDHFATPDAILDCRSLCLLLYGQSPRLAVTPRALDLATGTLDELTPAPMHDAAWRSERAFGLLLRLVVAASSAFVRGWCIAWLREAHAERLAELELKRLRPLLASPHGEAQSFGAELLERIEGWAKVSVDTWLQLARLDNPQALTVLARLMEEHVLPERLSLTQCLALSQSRVLPIASLGLRWAMDKGLGDDEALRAVSSLADAETEAVRREGLAWVRPKLVEKKRSLLLRDLVDSRHRDVREVALEVSAEPLYEDDARVHAAMAESPYGDVTDTLAARLQDWQKLDEGSLQHLWATILLGVRRGSRAKRATLRALAERAIAFPDKAGELLPLVAVALRSVRETERRAALATLARAAFADPELATLIAEHIDDLAFDEVPSGRAAS
ncbi:MAG: hypothetical protein R3B72_45250 [Polyangiaceae bacterium]